MASPNVTWTACGELLVICPKCGANHEFSQVSFGVMILDGNELDDFRIEQGGGREFLHPHFVCRNQSCDFRGIVVLPKG